jgi:hypothetical protein
MTPRERVLAALAGEMPDRVPFVIWNNKLPGEPVNGQLLECGGCIINKSTVYQVSTPGVEVEAEQLPAIDGLARRQKVFHTSAGDLTTKERITPGSIWFEKMPFCGPQDYEPLEAFIRSRIYTACHDKFLADDRMHGEQSLARPETTYTPIQDLICKYMGVEVFCVEWADRRVRLLNLCEVIAEDRRKRLDLVAASPARFAIIEGNVITEVTGPECFEKYHIPYIEEACELLHKNGKWAGAHLDANNKLLADTIVGTSLDLIESFTPPPDCNLPLPEARRLWPDKTIQINFPSSMHLAGPEAVRNRVAEILKEAAPGRRFIVGVSEDVSERGVNTLVPLAKAIYDNGKTPIQSD